MADDQAPKPDKAAERAAARGTQSNPTAEPEEVRYSIDDLLANPRLLNTSRHAVAGAFHDSSRKTFTLDEAAKQVAKFLKAVPADPEEGDG